MKLKLLLTLLSLLVVNETLGIDRRNIPIKAAEFNVRPEVYDVSSGDQILDCNSTNDAGIQIKILDFTYYCYHGQITSFLNSYSRTNIKCDTFETLLMFCNNEHLISKVQMHCSSTSSDDKTELFNCYDDDDSRFTDSSDDEDDDDDTLNRDDDDDNDDESFEKVTTVTDHNDEKYTVTSHIISTTTQSNTSGARKSPLIGAMILMFLILAIRKLHILDN
ncbi:unnamed protein product [Diamesa hyperborea]